MVNSFNDFLGGGTSSAKSYNDYSTKMWGEPGTPEIKPQEADLNLAEMGTNLEDRLKNLTGSLKDLVGNLRDATLKHDNIERDGLRRIMEDHHAGEPTTIQKVVLTKELINMYGGDKDKITFGAQTLDRNNADEQFAKLKADAELAKQYLGEDIHVHRIDYKNGKPSVAIVVGVDAEAFNAVISAERKKEALQGAVALTKDELDKSHSKAVALEKGPDGKEKTADGKEKTADGKPIDATHTAAMTPEQQKLEKLLGQFREGAPGTEPQHGEKTALFDPDRMAKLASLYPSKSETPQHAAPTAGDLVSPTPAYKPGMQKETTTRQV